MIHSSISGLRKGPLIIFPKGRINGSHYRELVTPYIHRFLREIEEDVGWIRAILIEDNAPIHTARATQQAYLDQWVNYISWPANSPDLNPIENVWKLLKHRVSRRFPRTNDKVEQFIREE